MRPRVVFNQAEKILIGSLFPALFKSSPGGATMKRNQFLQENTWICKGEGGLWWEGKGEIRHGGLEQSFFCILRLTGLHRITHSRSPMYRSADDVR